MRGPDGAPATTTERQARLVEGRLRERLREVLATEVLAVGVLAALVWHARSPDGLDARVASSLYASPHTTLRTIAAAVTVLGKPIVVAVGSIAVAGWARWRYRDGVLTAFCPLSVAIASTIGHLLKVLVARPRPATASLARLLDYSYPSGHAVGSTALAMATILLVWSAGPEPHRRTRIAGFAVYAVAVCVSRLVLGVHYLSDVVGAALLATACVLVVGWFCSRSDANV